jgi:hypothetical protein
MSIFRQQRALQAPANFEDGDREFSMDAVDAAHVENLHATSYKASVRVARGKFSTIEGPMGLSQL